MALGLTAAQAAEWRAWWYLPVVAAIGFTGPGMQTIAMGPFIHPLQEAFGWSRAQISLGLTVSTFTSGLLVIPFGLLIDRWGPRRVALIGATLLPIVFAMLGTATGTMPNWILLWIALAFGNLCTATTVWTSAVATRFDAGRGLAIAVTVSGGAVGAVIYPPLVTALIEGLGWRSAFAALGGLWALVVFPLVFLFFRGAYDGKGRQAALARPADERPGLTMRQAVRRPAFYALLLAGSTFSFATLSIIYHFTPILTDHGAEPLRAAGFASLIGAAAFVGRVGGGWLLDRFPGHLVGAVAYLLPIPAALLLLFAGGDPAAQVGAALLLGLTMGGELDVVTYLVTRYFGLRHLGVILGAMMAAIAVGMGLGPVSAGAVFDHFGSYAPFLWLTVALMALSAASIAALHRTPVIEGGGH